MNVLSGMFSPSSHTFPIQTSLSNYRPDGISSPILSEDSYELCIVVAAYKIPLERINTFFSWNQAVFLEKKVRVFLVTDAVYIDTPAGVTQLVYPEELKTMSQAKLHNFGVRHAISLGHKLITRTDIDILFSPQVLNQIKNTVSPNKGLICITANIDKPEAMDYSLWDSIPKRYTGLGGCVSFHASVWQRLCGESERLVGWGAVDYDLCHRASRIIPVEKSTASPVYHLNHPDRLTEQWFPNHNEENLREVFTEDWYSPDWGDPAVRDPDTELYLLLTTCNIDRARVRQFLELNRAGFEAVGAKVLIVSDQDPVRIASWVSWLKIPDQSAEQVRLAAWRNAGLRVLSGHSNAIVVKTDVDIVFSLATLELVKKTVTPSRGLLCFCANIHSPQEISDTTWKSLEKRWSGVGACVALHMDTWLALRGENENLTGWGAEDFDILRRATELIPVTQSEKTPLYHLFHERRNVTRRFPDNNHGNFRSAYEHPWDNPNWGLAFLPDYIPQVTSVQLVNHPESKQASNSARVLLRIPDKVQPVSRDSRKARTRSYT